jgi:hypothetical protein
MCVQSSDRRTNVEEVMTKKGSRKTERQKDRKTEKLVRSGREREIERELKTNGW